MFKPSKLIPLAQPVTHGEELEFVKEAFTTNWVAPLGPNVDAFESEITRYLGIENCLATVSGTSAIFLALKLAGVGPGEKVLCSDMTFAATVNPVRYLGAQQVFVDSEYETWNMSPEALEKAFALHPDAKFVCLAHLYGTPAKMDEILEICRAHGAVLIEDAAEALSSTYKGRQCGTLGDYNAISFNGNKIITTSGGGMLLTHTKEARDKAFFWATQAREDVPWYQHNEIGYNFRMSNIVAGVGRGQLIHIEEHKAIKKKIYARYAEGLRNLPVAMNPALPDSDSNRWLSCMTINKDVKADPIDLFYKLKDNMIQSRPIWKPMHMQPVYEGFDFVSTGVGEDVFARGLCLPSHTGMTEEEQDYVISQIKAFFD